ncbi:hypothetical protein KGF56_004740 [Candida oxycetoniae]|uniref:Major facilitator superfamily (MFS) profile domain-containing protein n=1 Tax=Candida oxycetoniae TaxID=497107 RepID=A0AAI9STE7_9ASCO|nr:uncharacterized protein KGF56_004740 [Candida oxycetoniae]KAI3402499.1 hypothetical protein KGF56_004740 [Candida oxycetoniae]
MVSPTSSTSHTDHEKNLTTSVVERIPTNEVEKSTSELTEEHKQYLIAKHGTYELDPIPSMNDDDPLNWSKVTKYTQVGMISFHAFVSTFCASGLVPTLGVLSAQFGITTATASYLVGVQILLIGVFPLFWVPFMQKYGKRQLMIVSALGACFFNLGGAYSNSYGVMMAMRSLQAVFISPGLAVGGAVVNELTFSHQRGVMSGVWSIAVNLGTMAGALFMGFVAEREPVRVVFFVFLAINAFQVVAYLLFGKETLFNYNDLSRNETNRFKQLVSFKAIIPEFKLDLKTIVNPFTYFGHWRIFAATLAYAVCFAFDNIATNVEIPEVMYVKFGMGPQALGLQFLGLLIGTIIGEVGGYASDKFQAYGARNNKGNSFRLWVTYPGFATSVIGIIVFGYQIDAIVEYNITPLVGLAICAFGLQIITAPLISYCITVNPVMASDIILFISFVRQILAFVATFFLPVMFATMGFTMAYSLMAILMAATAFVPVLILHIVESRKGR